jgi:hypothetical protein
VCYSKTAFLGQLGSPLPWHYSSSCCCSSCCSHDGFSTLSLLPDYVAKLPLAGDTPSRLRSTPSGGSSLLKGGDEMSGRHVS